MTTYLHPLARFLVTLIFIMSGVGKVFGFTQTAAMMGGVGFPAPGFFLVGAILLEVVGGVLLLVGYKARWGALALVIFLIPATLIFHVAGRDPSAWLPWNYAAAFERREQGSVSDAEGAKV